MASPFSGSSGRKAAMAEMTYLDGVRNDLNDRIKGGRTASLEALNNGYKDALGNNLGEYHLYDPYVKTGLTALNQYSDASGVNGQEGYDRAAGNFRASPGYQWQVDQATDGVARKASALGTLGSGNTMAAITDRASNLADQEYDDYLGRLDGINKQGFAATGAQAGVLSDRAGLFQQKGQDKANTFQNYTGMSVDANSNIAQQYVQSLHGGMMAGQNAAANRWNFGMQVGQTLASLAGNIWGGKKGA